MLLTAMKRVTPDSGRPYHQATVEHDGERVVFHNRHGSWMHEDEATGRKRHALPEVASYLQEELLIFDKGAVLDRKKIKTVVVSAEAMGEVARAESKSERRRRSLRAAA